MGLGAIGQSACFRRQSSDSLAISGCTRTITGVTRYVSGEWWKIEKVD
jgi:hypothetical protein